jgi:hypothetical protein
MCTYRRKNGETTEVMTRVRLEASVGFGGEEARALMRF